jgi:hypothetical protein
LSNFFEQKNIADAESKQKLEMEELKKEFKQILNSDLEDLRKELENAPTVSVF